MFNDIFKEYKENFDFKNCYFKYFNKRKLIVQFILSILILLISIKFAYKLKYKIIITLIICFFIFYCCIIIRNEMNRINKRIYNKNTQEETNNYRSEKFKKYIYEQEINTRQLEYLINFIDKQIKESKIPIFIKNGFVFGTVWIKYIDVIFESSIESNIDSTILMILINLTIITLIFATYPIKILYDDFINRDFNKMRSMNYLLKQIYLEKLKNEVNN